MIYKPKFPIGAFVWMVRHERFYRIVKCFPCKNTGNITIGDEQFICPKCGGRSAHSQFGGDKYYVAGSSEVGKVSIEHVSDRHDYLPRDGESNPRISYMLWDTGVGSGQVWDESALFASEQEAQDYCDLKNKILPANECALLDAPVDDYGRVRT